MRYGILNTDTLGADRFISASSELEAMQMFCKDEGVDDRRIKMEGSWYSITIDGVLYQCIPVR